MQDVDPDSPPPPSRARRAAVLLAVLVLALAAFLLAAHLRLRGLDQAVVGSDSLGPYLRALALSPEALRAGTIPRPPNPESGDWLWLSAWPLVHAAASLHDLFRLRLLLGATIAPLGLLAAWVWAAPERATHPVTTATWRQGFAAVAAGLVLAVDPGLADSLVSGARGYGAPEWLALCTLALALAWRGSLAGLVLAAAAFVIAVDHHPMAGGLLLSLLVLLPALGARVGLVEVGTASLVGLLFALPRILRLIALAACGQDPLTCLAEVAQSNVHEQEAVLAEVAKALHDRFLVDLDSTITLGLGLGVAMSRPWRGVGALALGGLGGMLLLAFVTGYLQGYHLRVLAGPLAVAAAVGLARAWPLALAWAGWAAWVGLPEAPVGPDPGAAARHDALAARIADQPGPLWVDRAWWGGQPVVDPSAVVLSAVLQGQDPARFQADPAATFLLLGNGAIPSSSRKARIDGGEVLDQGHVAALDTAWELRAFPSPVAARAWVDAASTPPAQVGGAFDWLTALHPVGADAEQTRW